MNLANVFYTVGIICMTLYTLLLIAVVILLFYIKKKITDFTDSIQERIEIAKDITKHPKEIAISVGAAVADTAINKAARAMKSKKNKNR